MFAYAGSRTTRERKARGEGISVFRVDDDTGALTLLEVVGGLPNPSFQAYSRRHGVLYSVHGDLQDVSAHRVDAATGRLTLLNTVSCQGRNPVHLALDPEHRYLVISNHLTSALAVVSIHDDGTLGEVEQLVRIDSEPGPHRKEQPFPKPHFNPFDPSGRYVVVPDKGADKLFCYRFEGGRLTPAAVPEVASREGAGPRHIAFHPQQPWVYCVNELDSTVTAYHFDTETGALAPFQIVSALSDRYTGNSRASEIEVHPAGHAVYASNRGEDSIAVLAIDPATGRLSLQQTVPCGGRTPRFFALHPSGRWLYVLNEDSDTIVPMAVDAAGHLTPCAEPLHCGSPVCLTFV